MDLAAAKAAPRPAIDPAYAWIGGLTVLRLAIAPAFGLAPQEAYYFLYSQHLQLSYFDHPPAVALLIAAFAAVLGKSVLSIRLAALAATLVTQLAFVELARRFRAERAVPVFASTGAVTLLSLISLPDVPLLMFWTLALVQLHRAIFEERRAGWILGGLFMGLAFDGKYTGAFLQIGLAAYLVTSPRGRALLRTPWPWIAIALAQLTMLPVYVWNAQHGFASFAFQTAGRASRFHGPQVRWLAGLLGSQLALVFPPLLWALARAVPAALPRRRRREEHLFLVAFSAPLAGLMVLVAVFLQVKPNWLLPAYVTGAILAARWMSRRAVRLQLAASVLVHVLLVVELVTYAVPIRSDDTWFGWRELATEVERRLAPGAFVFSADDYKTTAELRFHSDVPAYARNVIGERALEFDYLGEELDALAGRDALFLDSRPREADVERCGRVPDPLLRHFASAREEDPIVIRRRGEVVRKFCVWTARGYRGPAAREP